MTTHFHALRVIRDEAPDTVCAEVVHHVLLELSYMLKRRHDFRHDDLERRAFAGAARELVASLRLLAPGRWMAADVRRRMEEAA